MSVSIVRGFVLRVIRLKASIVAAAAIAVLALGVAGASQARAQQPRAAKPAAMAAKAAPPAQVPAVKKPVALASAAKGLSTGIKVHGHWVIEVKNPDGKVTARREFENTIQLQGEAYLASLLAGNNSPGGLSILLNGKGFLFSGPSPSLGLGEPGPCLPFSGSLTSGGPSSGTGCLIAGGANAAGFESLLGSLCSNASPQSCSTNLTATAPAFTGLGAMPPSSGGTQIVLNGSVLATSSDTGEYINDVETVLTACDANSTPGNCVYMSSKSGLASGTTPSGVSLFTQRLLNGAVGTATAPVPWSPGQTIAVTVTISFQ
jgi:hypothetical protein